MFILLFIRLASEGIEQSKSLNKEIQTIIPDIQVIYVSPLTRTIQTMENVFEGTNCPRIVQPLIRERYGIHICDSWINYETIKNQFPSIDHSLITDMTDETMTMTTRETNAHVYERCEEFLKFIGERKESIIGVVSHSDYLQHLFAKYVLNDTSKKGFHDAYFQNCQIKVLEISPN